MPVLFTTPLALTSSLAPVLSLSATLGAYRLRMHLAGLLAGIVAALALTLQPTYLRTQLFGYSEAGAEPMPAPGMRPRRTSSRAPSCGR